jgi:hypothetical protein
MDEEMVVDAHPARFLYSASCFSLHLWHQPYITSCGWPAWKHVIFPNALHFLTFSSSVHSHIAVIFIQKRHFPHPCTI